MSTPWLDEARRLIGVAEIAGAASNSKILGWAKALGGWVASFYKNDDTAWCGLFVAHCVQVGAPKAALPANPLSALAWAKFGDPVRPALGAILVFQRPGGGHVGLYLGETDDAFYVLGGNQGNKVSKEWIAKTRCVAVRWPTGVYFPGAGAVILARSGKLSTNES